MIYVKGIKSVFAQANNIFWEKCSFCLICLKIYYSLAYVIYSLDTISM